MTRKMRWISQAGLVKKTLENTLDTNIIYRVLGEYGPSWYAVAISSSEVEEFDSEFEARMVGA